MQRAQRQQVNNALLAKHRHQVWLRIASTLMAIVVFCTTYALILPGITLGKNTVYCGMEEHTHTEDCYGVKAVPLVQYTCDPESGVDFVIHTHDEWCYDSTGALVCTLTERSGHTHDESCYDADGSLTCTQVEVKEHLHTMDCMDKETEFLICGQAAIRAHQHSADCAITPTTKVQLCTQEEGINHTHDEMCYDSTGALVCTLAENSSGHTHTDACYDIEYEYTCGKTAEIAHEHTASCYTTDRILSCGMEQTIGHIHGEGCYDADGSVTCGLEEGHVHGDYCYTEVQTLTCGMEEGESHIHTSDCVVEHRTLTCTEAEAPSHQHTADCFEETPITRDVEVLTCELPEHTHDDSCYVEPEALQFAYDDGYISGRITLPWHKDLPSDLSCTLQKLSEDDADYAALYNSALNTLEEDHVLNGVAIYRILWESDGAEYTLPDGLTATATLDLSAASAGNETANAILLNDDASVAEDASQEEELELTSSASVFSRVAAFAQALVSGDDDDTSDADSDMDSENSATLELTSSARTIAVTRSSAISGTADYYEQITDLSQLTSESGSNEFVIVSSSGMVMLGNNTVAVDGYNYDDKAVTPEWTNCKNVVIYPVKSGDNTYYTLISDGTYVNDTKFSYNHWTITRVASGDKKDAYWKADDPCYLFMNVGLKTTYKNNPAGYLWMGESASWYSSGYYYYRYSIGMCLTDRFMASGSKVKSDSASYITKFADNSFRMYCNIKTGGTDNRYWLTFNAINGTVSQETNEHHLAYDITTNTTDVNSIGLHIEDNFYLFRRVKTSVTVYNDEAEAGKQEQTALPTVSDKPAFADDVSDISGTVQQSGSAVTIGDLEATIDYVSDPATSTIEDEFQMADTEATLRAKYPETADISYEDYMLYDEQEVNDGRVITDKTVIYGDDDYDAISDYEDGDFSVTLSALGQEWTLQDIKTETEPVDVLFLLDLSESMFRYPSVDNPRWKTSADAINAVAEQLMEQDADNRVGVVLYSSVSKELLPLDHYQLDNGKLLTYDMTYTTSQTKGYPGLGSLATASNLKTSSGTTVSRTTVGYTDVGMWALTNIQSGIQQAYKTLEAASATKTVTRTVDDTQQEVTRQPVIILLSDGEPTKGTYNYMNPMLNSGYVGNPRDGILSYYSILSCNYFKNLTSIAYGKQTKFFSIGIGVDRALGRATLSPTKDRVKALISGDDQYSYDLYNLLNGAYSGSFLLSKLDDTRTFNELDSSGNYITNDDGSYKKYKGTLIQAENENKSVGLYYGDVFEAETNYANVFITADSNIPYVNYNFANEAYFGEFQDKELKELIEYIINRIQYINNYGFLLDKGTYVDITDILGDGMEVKEAPVLRYYGRNYTATSSGTGKDSGRSYTYYTYDYDAVPQTNDVGRTTRDLSTIEVRVYQATSTEGQRVMLRIPEEVFPTFYPNLYKTYYNEELPLRLIYRVGLSSDELETLAKTDGAVDKTYYTSATGSSTCYATFYPDSSNPYYTSSNASKFSTVAKTDNATSTEVYSFSEYLNATNTGVVQKLGNNGSIRVVLPEDHNSTGFTVTKKWKYLDGIEPDNPKAATVYLIAKGQRTLYQKTGTTYTRNGSTATGYFVVDQAELTMENELTHTFSNYKIGTDLEIPEAEGYVYKYTNIEAFYIMEAPVDGFDTTYLDKSGSTITTTNIGYGYYLNDAVSTAGFVGVPITSDGVTILNTQKPGFNLTKQWLHTDEEDQEPVKVYIYGYGTRWITNNTSSKTQGWFYIATRTLSADNDWTAYAALPLNTDFVGEENVSTYTFNISQFVVAEDPYSTITYGANNWDVSCYVDGEPATAIEEDLDADIGAFYLVDGYDVTLVNEPPGIVVDKQWDGVPTGMITDVSVDLYGYGTVVNYSQGADDDQPTQTSTGSLNYYKLGTYTLGEDNDWQQRLHIYQNTPFSTDPVTDGDTTYWSTYTINHFYVVETTEIDKVTAAYQDADGKELEPVTVTGYYETTKTSAGLTQSQSLTELKLYNADSGAVTIVNQGGTLIEKQWVGFPSTDALSARVYVYALASTETYQDDELTDDSWDYVFLESFMLDSSNSFRHRTPYYAEYEETTTNTTETGTTKTVTTYWYIYVAEEDSEDWRVEYFDYSSGKRLSVEGSEFAGETFTSSDGSLSLEGSFSEISRPSTVYTHPSSWASASGDVTIVNTTGYDISKVWQNVDSNARPDSVTIDVYGRVKSYNEVTGELKKDVYELQESIVLNADNNWSGHIKNWCDRYNEWNEAEEVCYITEINDIYICERTDENTSWTIGYMDDNDRILSVDDLGRALLPTDTSVVKVINTGTNFTVTKTWDGVPESEWVPITVNVYGVGTIASGDDAGSAAYVTVATLTLSADNDWKTECNYALFTKVTIDGVDYIFSRYYVAEEGGDDNTYDWKAVYQDKYGNVLSGVSVVPAKPDEEGITVNGYSTDSGAVNIINTQGLLVRKQWAGVDDYENKSVSFNVYGYGDLTVKNKTGKIINEFKGLTYTIDTGIPLSSINKWKYIIDNIKVGEPFEDDYNGYTLIYNLSKVYVAETKTTKTDWDISAFNRNGEALELQKLQTYSIGSIYLRGTSRAKTTTVEAFDATDLYITLVNSKGYVLPNTGGTGTQAYTTGGAVLLVAAAALYKLSQKWPGKKTKSKEANRNKA